MEKSALELGVRALAVQADVTRVAEVLSWVRRAADELGPVQAAVSCAAVARDLPLTRLDDADWRALTDTSLDGVFNLCQAVLPAMMQRESGRIIAVSSVSASYGDPSSRRPVPARVGIAGYTRALASQTRRFGIRVHGVVPAPAAARAELTAIWPPDSRPCRLRPCQLRPCRRLAADRARPGRGHRGPPVRQRRGRRRPGRVPALRRGRRALRHPAGDARRHLTAGSARISPARPPGAPAPRTGSRSRGPPRWPRPASPAARACAAAA